MKNVLQSMLLVMELAGCASTQISNDDVLQAGLSELFAATPGGDRYRIAVLPLVDFRTEEQDELGSYMANDVMYGISTGFSDRVQLVERELITQLLNELQLDAMSGMISDADVKEFGEMSGADYLIFGSKLELDNSVEANLRLVEVESGEIQGVAKIKLAMDEKYASLVRGGSAAARDQSAGGGRADNPWTDGEDLSGSQVTLLGSWQGEEAEKFVESMAPFERSTGIELRYQSEGDVEAVAVDRAAGGDAPDIAVVSSIGSVKNLVGAGLVYDVDDWFSRDFLREHYSDTWLDLSTVDGTNAGVWYRASVKSLVWYNRDVFEREQYPIPNTWQAMMELSNRMVDDGYVPWSIGIERGGATGWVVTDWIEDFMLRIHPPETYDRWIAGRVRFDSSEVRAALDYLDEIWFDDRFVLGGTGSVAETGFGDAIFPLVNNPPAALMHRQASFIVSYLPDDQPELESTLGVFYLPPIDPSLGRPVLGIGDLRCPLADRPEIRAAMRYLSHGESTRKWAESGGFASPHLDTSAEWFPSEIDRDIADIIRSATTFRFDASDLMPPAVGSGTFWTEMTNYVENEGATRDAVLRVIDESYPR